LRDLAAQIAQEAVITRQEHRGLLVLDASPGRLLMDQSGLRPREADVRLLLRKGRQERAPINYRFCTYASHV
jgi:hypothetical protein